MRLSEIYTSVQGEGPNTGLPIQFVRFGGCNMRCPGWPCDTQFAIDPIYKDEWAVVSPAEVFEQISLYPQHVCITGGEPLTQRTSEMQAFGEMLLKSNFKIDLFTNGSQGLLPWCFHPRTVVVMDWKLAGSGEQLTGIEMRITNALELHRKDAIKFVVKDLNDLIEAREISRELVVRGCQAPLWVGAVWGAISDEIIIEFITEFNIPWRLNVQVHKHIWEPTLRGV